MTRNAKACRDCLDLNGELCGKHAAEKRAADYGRRARVEWATDIRPRRQEWLVEKRIPIGTVSALAGRGGVGKTSYALHWAAQLSNGTLPGKYYGQPRATLVWSGEDPWDTVLVPRLLAAGADLSKIGRLAIDTVVDDTTSEVTPRLPLDAGAIREAINDAGAALVIIDPIASTMSGDLHREADVRAAVDALARVAETTGAVVMYVRHFGKGGGNASDKMSGSHAFRDAARSVFLFAVDDQDDGRVIVTQDKGNYAPPGSESFAYRLENTTVDTDDGPADVARVVDLGVCDVSVDDVINRAPARDDDFDEHDYTDDLKGSWLFKFLTDAGKAGVDVRPKDAVAYGADKGISRRSVFRLFDKLANAGMAESVDGDEFPRVTNWRVCSDTTGPTPLQGGTTGTTGLDLHKQGGTTGEPGEAVALQGGTTGSNSSELHKQMLEPASEPPVVPVVPPNPGALGITSPPGGPTAHTPGMTEGVQQIIASNSRNGRRPICPDCQRAPARSDTGRCDFCTAKATAAGRTQP